MSKYILGAVAGLALILSVVGLVGGNNQSASNLGGGTRFPNGISANSTAPAAGEVRGTTLTVTGAAATGAITSSGTLTLTTSNTATSSAIIGCIQTYATSTATAVRFVLSSAGTTTAIYGSGQGLGGVSWQYGTCPA